MSTLRLHFIDCLLVASACLFPPVATGVWAQPPSGEPPRVYRLPPVAPSGEQQAAQPEEVGGDFPPLPPDPYQQQFPTLPSLDEELFEHGGSHMRVSEGSIKLHPDEHAEGHFLNLRLPEDWQEPRPGTLFAPFEGTGPINHFPGHLIKYSIEPRFVAYGEYELFGLVFEQNKLRRDALGHQLLLDLDLRLTGTERCHMQFRPLGKNNTGGSFYQFNDPDGYVDNSTGPPERYWVEAELHSLLGPHLDPFGALDPHFVVGRIPFALHNTLLMNDEILAVVANQNNIDVGAISNINLQWFYGFNDVDTFADGDAQAIGLNATIDYQRTFYEWTYAFTDHEDNSGRDSHYLALSRTAFYGPTSLALRALFKVGDEQGIGSGQLFVLESNHTRYFTQEPWGVEYGVFYANAFAATSGWSSMGGGNFNRIRSAFEVNPLIRISAAPVLNDTAGVACGVQLFRRHEDESLVPELSLEFPGGTAVFGVGLRYLRKTGPRTFLEVLGILNESDDPVFDRAGVLVCHTFIL